MNPISTQERFHLWLEKLQASGYRITGPRRAVVQILSDSNYILNPTEIFLEARPLYPNIGLVTVYRTLEKLEELGLIIRVHEIDGCHKYIAGPEGHQHLLICTSCNRAEYFEGEDISPLIAQLAIERGYEITDHWLQILGTCPDCKAKLDTQK